MNTELFGELHEQEEYGLFGKEHELQQCFLYGVSVSLPDANPHICPECGWQCSCSDQPCSCCNER